MNQTDQMVARMGHHIALCEQEILRLRDEIEQMAKKLAASETPKKTEK